jgi:hypothetical protein
MHPIPSIADSVCPFMERALMGNIEIHPEDEMAADYLVASQRGESMMAAIIRSVKRQQEERCTGGCSEDKALWEMNEEKMLWCIPWYICIHISFNIP